jgi:hypothetical protein
MSRAAGVFPRRVGGRRGNPEETYKRPSHSFSTPESGGIEQLEIRKNQKSDAATHGTRNVNKVIGARAYSGIVCSSNKGD